MLGKLLKYDFKSNARLLLPIHIGVVICGILMRLLIEGGLFDKTPDGLTLFTITGYTLLLIAASYITTIIIAVRFYRHLFTTQGYLAFTLPVTPGQHLLSKTISGIGWMAVKFAALTLSLLCIILSPKVWNMIKDAEPILREVFAVGEHNFIFLIVILTISSAVSGVLMIYVCIAIGQLFSKHRIIAAIVAYFLITLIIQLATSLFSIGGLPHLIAPQSEAQMLAATQSYMLLIYKLSAVALTIQAIISYVVTYFIMNKKLNLN